MKRQQRRALVGVVHGGADLVGDHARVERRAERVVAVDHADGLGLRERPPPASRSGTGRNQRSRTSPTFLPCARMLRMPTFIGSEIVPMPDEDDLGVLRHVLLEPRVLGPAAEDLAEVGVGLLDHVVGALHRLVVLPADLDDPVLVGLRRHRDRVVGMQQQVAAVVRRQELVDLALGRHLRDASANASGRRRRPRWRCGRNTRRSSATGRRSAWCRAPPARCRPRQHPAEVAHDQRVVVLHAEGAGIVERPVADHADHRHAQRRR